MYDTLAECGSGTPDALRDYHTIAFMGDSPEIPDTVNAVSILSRNTESPDTSNAVSIMRDSPEMRGSPEMRDSTESPDTAGLETSTSSRSPEFVGFGNNSDLSSTLRYEDQMHSEENGVTVKSTIHVVNNNKSDRGS